MSSSSGGFGVTLCTVDGTSISKYFPEKTDRDSRISARLISLPAGTDFDVRIKFDEDLRIAPGDEIFATISIGDDQIRQTQTWRLKDLPVADRNSKRYRIKGHHTFWDDGTAYSHTLTLPPPSSYKSTAYGDTLYFGSHPEAQRGCVVVFIYFGQITEKLFDDEARRESDPPSTYWQRLKLRPFAVVDPSWVVPGHSRLVFEFRNAASTDVAATMLDATPMVYNNLPADKDTTTDTNAAVQVHNARTAEPIELHGQKHDGASKANGQKTEELYLGSNAKSTAEEPKQTRDLATITTDSRKTCKNIPEDLPHLGSSSRGLEAHSPSARHNEPPLRKILDGKDDDTKVAAAQTDDDLTIRNVFQASEVSLPKSPNSETVSVAAQGSASVRMLASEAGSVIAAAQASTPIPNIDDANTGTGPIDAADDAVTHYIVIDDSHSDEHPYADSFKMDDRQMSLKSDVSAHKSTGSNRPLRAVIGEASGNSRKALQRNINASGVDSVENQEPGTASRDYEDSDIDEKSGSDYDSDSDGVNSETSSEPDLQGTEEEDTSEAESQAKKSPFRGRKKLRKRTPGGGPQLESQTQHQFSSSDTDEGDEFTVAPRRRQTLQQDVEPAQDIAELHQAKRKRSSASASSLRGPQHRTVGRQPLSKKTRRTKGTRSGILASKERPATFETDGSNEESPVTEEQSLFTAPTRSGARSGKRKKSASPLPSTAKYRGPDTRPNTKRPRRRKSTPADGIALPQSKRQLIGHVHADVAPASDQGADLNRRRSSEAAPQCQPLHKSGCMSRDDEDDEEPEQQVKLEMLRTTHRNGASPRTMSSEPDHIVPDGGDGHTNGLPMPSTEAQTMPDIEPCLPANASDHLKFTAMEPTMEDDTSLNLETREDSVIPSSKEATQSEEAQNPVVEVAGSLENELPPDQDTPETTPKHAKAAVDVPGEISLHSSDLIAAEDSGRAMHGNTTVLAPADQQENEGTISPTSGQYAGDLQPKPSAQAAAEPQEQRMDSRAIEAAMLADSKNSTTTSVLKGEDHTKKIALLELELEENRIRKQEALLPFEKRELEIKRELATLRYQI